jgi:hypothetical protein
MAKRRFRAPQLRFSEAIALMGDGAVLRLEYDRGAPVWSLGGGRPVSPETVTLILASGGVETADDALIPGTPCQSWRLRQ